MSLDVAKQAAFGRKRPICALAQATQADGAAAKCEFNRFVPWSGTEARNGALYIQDSTMAEAVLVAP